MDLPPAADQGVVVRRPLRVTALAVLAASAATSCSAGDSRATEQEIAAYLSKGFLPQRPLDDRRTPLVSRTELTKSRVADGRLR